MGVRGAWRAALLVVALAALVACQRVPRQPAPKPPAQPTTQTCAASATVEDNPTPSNPVDYVAVVDPSGPATPRVKTFEATSHAEKDAKVAQLDSEGDVLAVDVDQPVHTLEVDPSDDPRYGVTQEQKLAIDQLGFPTAWSQSHVNGAGVTIAVVDTGVQTNHPDLAGQVTNGPDFSGGGLLAGHGTHVTGIAAAADNQQGGVGGAPGAHVVSVRVLNSSGAGSASAVAQGIHWAVDNGADVVNLSLGGAADAAMQEAVGYAVTHDVLVVAAAGNSGSCAPLYPAAYPGAIAVAALQTGTNQKASFSNFGSYVDLAAPGTSIDSTYPTSTYTTLSGTSMATPFVSAVAALVESKCPSDTAAHVRSILESTALYVAQQLGHGRVRADQALAAPC